MEVLLKPELEAKLDQLASETGRSKSDLWRPLSKDISTSFFKFDRLSIDDTTI